MANINDNGIDRPMTEKELETLNKAKTDLEKDMVALAAAADAKAAALASARAKLAALGLTADEIAAFLG